MTDGRTMWYAEDARWLAWERMVVIATEHGPAAVSTMVALKGEAKLQNEGWKVKIGYRVLAREAFVADVDKVRGIVRRAAEIGLLDDFEEGEWTFTCRISGMQASEQRARDALRKAAGRARTGPEPPGQNRTHPDLQNRTGQKKEESSLRSDFVEPALDAAQERLKAAAVRGLFEHWQQACGHPHAKLTENRRRKIQARLREGYTPEQIREAIDGAARAAFVNDEGRRFDDIELVCRNGSKLEDFIARASQAPQATAAANPYVDRKPSAA